MSTAFGHSVLYGISTRHKTTSRLRTTTSYERGLLPGYTMDVEVARKAIQGEETYTRFYRNASSIQRAAKEERYGPEPSVTPHPQTVLTFSIQERALYHHHTTRSDIQGSVRLLSRISSTSYVYT